MPATVLPWMMLTDPRASGVALSAMSGTVVPPITLLGLLIEIPTPLAVPTPISLPQMTSPIDP